MPHKKGRPVGPKKVKVQVYMPAELHQKVEDLAKEGYRPVSDQVRLMLDIALENMDREARKRVQVK
jgi:hypothetical protein